MEIVLLIAGLGILWIGAELVVNATSSIAAYYKVSPFFLGLTLLAIGTDLPETFILIIGSIEQRFGLDASSLLIGEIVGSSVSQISLILGFIGFFGVLVIKKKKMFREGIMLVASVLILFLMSLDGSIQWYEGLVMIISYIIYVLTIIREEKTRDKISFQKQVYSLRWAFFSLAGGFSLLMISSHITLMNALKIGEIWGLPQVFVGSVIVGLGTSLPEIITAIHAVRKKVVGLAVGGLIGSNIYDVLVPVGLGASIFPLTIPNRILYFDIPFLFILSGIVLLFFRKDYTMTLKESSILIGIYLCYFIIQLLWL